MSRKPVPDPVDDNPDIKNDQADVDPFAALAAITAERDQLASEKAELEDRMLRAQAEFQNFRKRSDRDRLEFSEYASLEAVRTLLPVIDDFERALQSDAPGAESYRQGLDIIHRALIETLRKRGVTPINAVGTDFDPQIHQAVAYEADPERRDGEVTEQFTRGYRLGDKLIRPAMVKVAKA